MERPDEQQRSPSGREPLMSPGSRRQSGSAAAAVDMWRAAVYTAYLLMRAGIADAVSMTKVAAAVMIEGVPSSTHQVWLLFYWLTFLDGYWQMISLSLSLLTCHCFYSMRNRSCFCHSTSRHRYWFFCHGGSRCFPCFYHCISRNKDCFHHGAGNNLDCLCLGQSRSRHSIANYIVAAVRLFSRLVFSTCCTNYFFFCSFSYLLPCSFNYSVKTVE